MEGLKTLIRNLTFILLLATFLELLLPGDKMKGFVRMIMGLFVIAAILAPLTDLLRLDFGNAAPAWVNVPSSDMPVLAADPNSKDIGKSAVREQYRRILISQIRQLVLAVDGVQDAEIEVELDKSSGGFGDYPQILKVQVFFSTKSSVVTPVSPIIVGGDPASETAKKETEKAAIIKRQVSSLMQIPSEIISVSEQ